MIIPNITINTFEMGYGLYYAEAGEKITLHAEDEKELVESGKAEYV